MAFGLDMAVALLFQSDVATFCRKKGVYVGGVDQESHFVCQIGEVLDR